MKLGEIKKDRSTEIHYLRKRCARKSRRGGAVTFGTRIDGRRIFTRRANRERERERMESTIVVEKARRDERKKAGRLIFRGRPTNLERERGREKEGEEEGAKKRERIHRGRMVDRWNALGRSTIANWKNTPIRLQFFSSARTHRAAEEFETGLAYDEKYIRRAR